MKKKQVEKLNLYGLHTVIAALGNADRKKHLLIVTDNAFSRLDTGLVTGSGVQVETCTSSRLDQLVGAEAVHQGMVLNCDPLDMLDASELFHLASAKFLLVLDQITDPHNAGAILRSAVAMKVDAVLMTSRNSATETAVLAKSACGALDMIKLVHLRNLSKAIEELNSFGFQSIGLDSEGPMEIEEAIAAGKSGKIALVLGSEGKGLRQQTRETCAALARLDMPGEIKSLNVSNAAALSLYLASRYLRIISR